MSETTLAVVLLGLVPFALLATTSFAKLSIVIGLLRSAFGPGELPPSAVVIVLAALLTGYVMLPVAQAVSVAAAPQLARVDPQKPLSGESGRSLWAALDSGKEPLRSFLDRNAGAAERGTFAALLKQRLPEPQQAEVDEHALAVVLPAFFVTELKEALQLGFLLLLPFFVLDVVVASMLTALGMHGLPVATVALPFKLLLFVSVDGFRTLVDALVGGYI
ncbi:MAG: EscR/YscR/HrcR family type III secretion system export apparatus protein [Polyangiales bacterium]